jgi:hypothetical protein
MDIGDAFYGLWLGVSMMLVTVSELIALSILICRSFMHSRSRIHFALVAVLFLAAGHWAIASSGVGWWHKIFLGCDPAEDVAWLSGGYDHTNDPPLVWLAFNAVCHVVVLLCMGRWLFRSHHGMKTMKQESVLGPL